MARQKGAKMFDCPHCGKAKIVLLPGEATKCKACNGKVVLGPRLVKELEAKSRTPKTPRAPKATTAVKAPKKAPKTCPHCGMGL